MVEKDDDGDGGADDGDGDGGSRWLKRNSPLLDCHLPSYHRQWIWRVSAIFKVGNRIDHFECQKIKSKRLKSTLLFCSDGWFASVGSFVRAGCCMYKAWQKQRCCRLLVALQCSSQLTNKVQITLTFKKQIMLMSMKALTSSTLTLEVLVIHLSLWWTHGWI